MWSSYKWYKDNQDNHANPDNPDNYQAPVFGNHVAPDTSRDTDLVETSKDMRETAEGDLKAPGDEAAEEPVDVVHTEGNTRVVVHHDKNKGKLSQYLVYYYLRQLEFQHQLRLYLDKM